MSACQMEDTDLLREPRRDEGHLEGVAVRVQDVERVGVHGPDHGVDRAGEPVAYCNMIERESVIGSCNFPTSLRYAGEGTG